MDVEHYDIKAFHGEQGLKQGNHCVVIFGDQYF